MKAIILILFAISLLNISISNRLRGFARLLTFQGFLLFVLAFIQLNEITILNLVFVLFETLVFKTIVLPLFLDYVIKKNRMTREAEPYVPYFFSLLIVSVIILASFIIVQQIEGLTGNTLFFIVALSTLFTGLYIIISRKKLITHMMGYIVMENGIFILSLAIGNEMPMMVNTGILIDLFVGILVMGIFVNKIGDVFQEANNEYLSQIRD